MLKHLQAFQPGILSDLSTMLKTLKKYGYTDVDEIIKQLDINSSKKLGWQNSPAIDMPKCKKCNTPILFQTVNTSPANQVDGDYKGVAICRKCGHEEWM